MVKAVNVLKFLSALVFLLSLLLVYAYAPVMVQLRPESRELMLQRESFFYTGLTIFVLINVGLMVIQKLFEPQIARDEVKAWVRGFTFVINLYLAFLIAFIGILNNPAHLKAADFAYLNYLGPVLVVAWLVGLIYLVLQKPKSA